MATNQRSLKAFLYFTKSDRSVVESLRERLELDGVDVIISESVVLETETGWIEERPTEEERRAEILDVIQDADVILFCLSKQFGEISALNDEWKFVLAATVEKRLRDKAILPVRLEECTIPQTMKRWLPIDLYLTDGYEKLMRTLKLRAGMVWAALDPDESWDESFYEPVPVYDGAVQDRKISMTVVIALLVLVGVAVMLFVRVTNMMTGNETPIPVDVLAENATQNALSIAADRAGTATSNALSFSEPLTQTAVYKTTTEPLVLTATAIQARVTPTITLTSVSLPTQIIVSDNIPMMLVPGGRFIIGYDDDPDAGPAGLVDLDAYYIDQYEVTNAQYQICVSAGECQPPNDFVSQTRSQYYGTDAFADFPVINVDWTMARMYCEWRGARLPTEAEWEAAARGFEALYQPWGEGAGCIYGNYDNCIGDTQPVDKYLIGKSEFDVYNMAGNVSEWVSSLYLPYPYNPLDDRENPVSNGPRVVRGGSWVSSLEEILTYHRIGLDPESASVYGNDLGFRCARDVSR
ncbi:MAG TPA: SUMF1/EgtB/PvdO family nonheme iron enzyme [Anaerolineales bacterium]|nr:SUMF1/EgtB/PvdO family nonheme iron enzyme [Anaerolineales bacterium]